MNPPPVELLDGADEAQGPLLDEVEERQAAAPVALGDRDHEAQVGLDHLLLGGLVAELDALREADLVGGREKGHAADVLEEELERVGRLLDRRDGTPRALHLLGDLSGARAGLGLLEELDTGLLEVLVDLLGAVGVEAQAIEDLGDLLHPEEAHLLPADDQLAELTVPRQPGHLLRRHPPPFPRGVLSVRWGPRRNVASRTPDVPARRPSGETDSIRRALTGTPVHGSPAEPRLC